MTVLILATEHDISVDRVVRALADRDVPVFRADLGWFPRQLTLDAELRDGRWVGQLATAHRDVALEDLRSVWYRGPSAFEFPVTMSATERRHAQHEAKLGLGGVLASLPVLWVNHPSRHADAGYKPRQLVAAASAGLGVVATLVTNDAATVRRFVRDSGPAGVVTKMFGAPAICEQGGRRVALTQRLTGSDLGDLRGIETTAHQFQSWASKREEVRVIVIGRHVFAVAIHANSDAAHVDWRADYAALDYERITPPDAVRRGIRAVMAALELEYGAFDFVVTPEGQWVFLEVNPSGQYGWLAEVPLTEAMADFLAQGAA
ncbi:MAG: ATP-grasp ribosomal peptide maturase [Pseudonocardiaceae bacterium]|nr:ATP-grasp ribosomal peptide maturase [Pseudonocardiaceae bacterium]